jgi:hypothetical protein
MIVKFHKRLLPDGSGLAPPAAAFFLPPLVATPANSSPEPT